MSRATPASSRKNLRASRRGQVIIMIPAMMVAMFAMLKVTMAVMNNSQQVIQAQFVTDQGSSSAMAPAGKSFPAPEKQKLALW